MTDEYEMSYGVFDETKTSKIIALCKCCSFVFTLRMSRLQEGLKPNPLALGVI